MRRISSLLVATLLVVAFGPAAQAAYTIYGPTWTGATGTDWTVGTNWQTWNTGTSSWDPSHVPAGGEIVQFTLAANNLNGPLPANQPELNTASPPLLGVFFMNDAAQNNGAGTGGWKLSGTGTLNLQAGNQGIKSTTAGVFNGTTNPGMNAITVADLALGGDTYISVVVGGALAISSVISDGGAGYGIATGSGGGNTGTLVLTGLNTYSGQTRAEGGPLLFNSIANVGGGASALGAPTTTTAGTIVAGTGSGPQSAYLGYIGTTNASTDRTLNVNVSREASLFLLSMGTGTISFPNIRVSSGSGSGRATRLALRGSNGGDNTLGAISDGEYGPLVVDTGNAFGACKWVLSGTNTYTGGTTVGVGTTLQLGNASSNGTVAKGIVVNGNLVFANATAQTFSGNISKTKGTGTVTKTGAGVLTLSGTCTYIGNTTVSEGTLLLGSGGSILLDVNNSTSSYSRFLGAGILDLEGTLKLDVGDVTANADTWQLVAPTLQSTNYGATFAMQMSNGRAFKRSGGVLEYVDGTRTWTFTESSGVLSLTRTPETSTAEASAPKPSASEPSAPEASTPGPSTLGPSTLVLLVILGIGAICLFTYAWRCRL
jgi:autotransporter-associated beta strand protein